MRTTKPFSTVSYNSPEFLKQVLDDYIDKHIISFYAFIKHHKEIDEGKDHIHLLCVPDSTVDTWDLSNNLKEFDEFHPDKPLGIRPCRRSVFGDWYLYNLHDPDYLASKFQTREYHYKKENFVVSDLDDFENEIDLIDMTHYQYTRSLNFIKLVRDGAGFTELCKRGIVPISQMQNYASFYNMILEDDGKQAALDRNGRLTHTPVFLDSSGLIREADPVEEKK